MIGAVTVSNGGYAKRMARRGGSPRPCTSEGRAAGQWPGMRATRVMGAQGPQGPDAPGAPSTRFTVLLRSRPATAVTVYSPGATAWLAPLQPGEEVLRSQETRRTAGLPRTRTIMFDPRPLTQSAELQMRPPAATTTDTNLVPMLKRHGCPSLETACTVNRGIVPDWYQYCGDESRSATAPGAQARAFPGAGECAVLRCGDGTGSSRGEGEGAGSAGPLVTCAPAEPAALVPPGEAARSADERAASMPFTVQLRAVSNPMPTVKTATRRRQYVAGEVPADRVRAPRGGSAVLTGSWPISVKYARWP